MRLAPTICIAVALGGIAAAKPVHPCADDARTKAAALLRLHFEGEGGTMLAPQEGAPSENDSGELMNWSIDDTVKVLQPASALVGKGKFDVLEVYGAIYKASYRMHFLYAQIEGTCALMGQEILEESDPY